MESLYPLKFQSIFKEKIWGGNKLKTLLNKDYGNLPNCGESWEISGVKGNESIVIDGPLKGQSLPDLIEKFKERLVGRNIFETYGKEFPLLIKFLDAQQDLSIQVHPDDSLANKRHNCLGKTEMWYIFQADEGASLISGFNKSLTREEYLKNFKAGKIEEILNHEKVFPGDVFFIPAGRVHTIGKGICIAEIQQTSDITYRIYDFDRIDDKGNKRELHIEESLDAIDFKYYPEYKTQYKDIENQAVELINCPYFHTSKLQFNTKLTRDYSKLDSFIIYICYEGTFIAHTSTYSYTVTKGECLLVPAECTKIILEPTPTAGILEVNVDSR